MGYGIYEAGGPARRPTSLLDVHSTRNRFRSLPLVADLLTDHVVHLSLISFSRNIINPTPPGEDSMKMP